MPQCRIGWQHRSPLWELPCQNRGPKTAVRTELIFDTCKAWQIGNKYQDRAQIIMRNIRGRGIGVKLGSRSGESLVVGLTVALMKTVPPIDLPGEMARAAELVEQALEVLLPPVEAAEGRLAEAMRYATLGGGKRLRAFLVMQSASLFSVSETCAARVAASVEMLHAYSRVHDALPSMDNDDLRRGKPSTHRAFDEATAILAGDALQTRAFEVLAEADTHSDPQARCELVAALGGAAGARGMAGGQMIDMLAEGQTLTDAEVTRLQALKTGRLIQYSAEAGAILGRAPQMQRHLLA